MIFTFYSFKGGVGRSMVLANVAELLYQRGLNVLMIDFDLEAPGLERFFSTPIPLSAGPYPLPPHSDVLHSRGVLDLLISYKALRTLPLAQSKESPTSADTSAEGLPTAPGPFPYRVEPLKNFIASIRGPDPLTGGSLSLMPAGRRDDNEYALYADRIRAFDWEDFFSRWNGAQFFDWFGRELSKDFDVVLIDSRTGITEMSGVCTHFLPDAVVLFVAANEQNVEGTRRMALSLASKELMTTRSGRKLSLLIVPSRVEINEGSKLKEFSDKFTSQLASMIDPRIVFRTSAFLDLRVPYIPYYAFGENVAVRDSELPVAADLIAASTRLCSAMLELVPKDNPIYSRYQAAQANLARTDSHVEFDPAPADFSGRDWVFDRIGEWLGRGTEPALLIIGAPGTGKSALAARLVEFATGAAVPPKILRPLGRSLVLAHSCSIESGWRAFMDTLARSLASRSPQFTAALARLSGNTPEISVRIQSRIGTSQAQGESAALTIESISIAADVSAEKAFRLIIQKPLQEAANSSKLPSVMLVIIDGLDMALDSSGKENLAEVVALASQPGALPPNFRLLVLSRPDLRVVQTVVGPTVDLSDSGKVTQDIIAYAEARLSEKLRGGERSEVVAQIGRAAQGNFLYARLLIEDLLAGGATADQIVGKIDDVLRPEKIPDTLRRIFIAMVQQLVGFNVDRWAQQYRPFFGALAVARNGLTLTQLVGITRRPQTEVADSLRAIGSFIIGSSPNGPFRLFHPAFGSFMLNEPEYGVSRAEAHEAIATFFLTEYEQDWERCKDTSVLRNTPYHLLAAVRESQDRRTRRELLDRLVDLLLGPAYLEARAAISTPVELQDDIDAVVKLAIQHPRYDDLLLLHLFLTRNPSSTRQGVESFRSRMASVSARADGEGADPLAKAGSQPRQDATPLIPSATDADASLRAGREQEALRRQIPASVLIELGVWQRARLNGAILLVISAALCGILLPVAFGVISYGNFPTDPLYGITAIAAGYLLYAARFEAMERKRKAAEPEHSVSALAPPESPRWETLPEILELRGGGKRYRLLGDIAVASPYFEIVLILFVFTLVVATFSRNTSPWMDLFSFRLFFPISKP